MKSGNALTLGLLGGFVGAVVLLIYLHVQAPFPVPAEEVQPATEAALRASLNYYKPKTAGAMNVLIEGKTISPTALEALKTALSGQPLSSDPQAPCAPGSATEATACEGVDYLDARFVAMPFLYAGQVQLRSHRCTQSLLLFKLRGSWYPYSSKQVCNKPAPAKS
ncbi:hypothetical protein [Chitinimonas sp.]|uniref:hypothetical protein n=1 Tax=Chitinimonas sp. TaxID=1934313 RepID=UPI002F920117